MNPTEMLQMWMGIVTVFAVIAGPILALYVQSWVNLNRERRDRKIGTFKTLMATRAARLTPEHVRALNMIDVEFNRKNRFFHRETKEDKEVIRAWNLYRDHLNSPPADPKMQVQWETWNSRVIELFVSLLHKMATCLDYDFDEVLIRKGIYSPEAFEDLERDQHIIRKALVQVLTGQSALKMDVASFPIDEKIQEAQKTQLQLSIESLEGNRPILVKVVQEEEIAAGKPDRTRALVDQ